MSSLTWTLLIMWALATWTVPMWSHLKVPEIPERPRKFLAAFIIALFACFVASAVAVAAIMSFSK